MPANDIPRVDRQHAEDAISELQAWAAHDRYRRVTCEIAVGAIRAALQSPPPREADAALWPLVERLVRELDDYDLRDEIHGLEPSVADAFDALRACRPPSAPALAVTPTADGIHYDHNDSTWGVCRKVIAAIRMDRERKRARAEYP